jgi:hypothetical protein
MLYVLRSPFQGAVAAGGNGSPQRAGRGQDDDTPGPRFPKHLCAGRRGRSGGEDVIHQQDPRRWISNRCERPGQGPSPVGSREPGLGSRLTYPPKQLAHRDPRPTSYRSSQELGLVEAPPGPTPPGQRNPGDDVGRQVEHLDHRSRQVAGQGVPSGELHPPDRRGHRPLVQERGSRRGHGSRRTVPARGHGRLRGSSAPRAPRRRDHPRLLGAHGTDRPSPTSAGGAPRREQHIDNRHAPTLPTPTDTPPSDACQTVAASCAAQEGVPLSSHRRGAVRGGRGGWPTCRAGPAVPGSNAGRARR